MNIDTYYKKLYEKKSDINEHLPTLRQYASKVNHVTEMGVRRGRSTLAFIYGKPKKLVSYDIVEKFDKKTYKEFAYDFNVDFVFIKANVLKVEIEETDMLFIDTLHRYTQLKQELKLHSGKVKKYIIMHDTTTFGEVGEKLNKMPEDFGLTKAINEFLLDNYPWIIKQTFTNNNGLTVLERKQ